MCGIAGMVRLGDKPIEPAQLKSLLIGLQIRGGDATGIATMTGGKVAYHKDHKIAWQFCGDKETDNFLEENLTKDTDMVLLHTRSATKGYPWKNENNHPLTAGKTAVMHNGTIQNDEDLFKEFKLERSAETDSDILRAILDRDGLTRDGIRTLKRVRGSCAISAISPEYPDQLLLGRAGSPLVLAHTDDYFLWASIKEPLYRAMRIWKEWHGLWFQAARPDLTFNPMLRETIYLWDINKLRNDPGYEPWEEEFDVCKNYVTPTYRVHERYPDKQATWKAAQIKEEAEKKEQMEAEARRLRQETARREQKKVVDHKPADQQDVPGTAGLVEQSDLPGGGLIVLKTKPDQKARLGQRFMCGNRGCGQLMQIGKVNDGKLVWELECPRCHQLLAEFDSDGKGMN